jgi:hypothetical protein
VLGPRRDGKDARSGSVSGLSFEFDATHGPPPVTTYL